LALVFLAAASTAEAFRYEFRLGGRPVVVGQRQVQKEEETLESIRGSLLNLNVFKTQQGEITSVGNVGSQTQRYPGAPLVFQQSNLPGSPLTTGSRLPGAPLTFANKQHDDVFDDGHADVQLSGVSQWFFQNMPDSLTDKDDPNGAAVPMGPRHKNPQESPLLSAAVIGQPQQPQQPTEESDLLVSDVYPSGFPHTFMTATEQEPTLKLPTQEEQSSCPATCKCVCEHTVDLGQPILPKKEVSLTRANTGGLSLFPCARAAGYRLNLAVELCRSDEQRKRALAKLGRPPFR